MTAAADILAALAQDGRGPTKFEVGTLRAALPSADAGTADAINAILNADTPENYLAAVRKGRAAAHGAYPILDQEQTQ